MKLVSIIMTCLNGEAYLKKALESIFVQTYKNWELIFVDNNSSDNSKQIIFDIKDDRIKYFKLDSTVNLGTIRKFAFSKCSGDFITFLDVDDYWDEKKLDKQLAKFNNNEKADVVYSNYIKFKSNEFEQVRKKLFSGNCQKQIIESYIEGKPLTAWLTLMIKKKSIENLSYSFDENLHICSDFDLIIRLSNNCYFDYDEEFLSYYRLHSMNESKDKSKEISELAYIFKKFNKEEKVLNFLNKNNFLDKVLLKNFINNRLSNKKFNNNIYFRNIIFKILYLFIKFSPKYLIKVFK